MKVAIHSLPRCGTKSLQINFNNYLKTLRLPVLGANHPYGVGEPFNVTSDEYHTGVTTNRIQGYDDNGPVFEQGEQIPLYKELSNRLLKLIHRRRSWVFKRNNFLWGDPLLFDTMINVDKCIAIVRDDTFNHCLSFCLADKLQIWKQCEQLNHAIVEYSADKIILDPEEFLAQYTAFSEYRKIPWPSEFQVVNFQDLIQISSSEEFCNFFNLEVRPFEFKEFNIEYGDNKFNMVKNINELKKICNVS